MKDHEFYPFLVTEEPLFHSDYPLSGVFNEFLNPKVQFWRELLLLQRHDLSHILIENSYDVSYSYVYYAISFFFACFLCDGIRSL